MKICIIYLETKLGLTIKNYCINGICIEMVLYRHVAMFIAINNYILAIFIMETINLF